MNLKIFLILICFFSIGISSNDCIIHVGYPKTGTTSLQNVLKNNSQVNILCYAFGEEKKIKNNDYFLKKLEEKIFFKILTPQEITQIRSEVLKLKKKDKVFILSNENLVCLDGNIECAINAAKNLKLIFPKAKIIFTIREQKSLLKSWYFYAYPRQLSNILNTDFGFNKWLAKSKIKEALDFYKLINIYKKIFGFENIHLLLMEELAKNPANYATKLSNILGINASSLIEQFVSPIGKSHTKSFGYINYIYNTIRDFLNIHCNWILQLLHHFTFIKEKVHSYINKDNTYNKKIPVFLNGFEEVYKKSNQLLDKEFNLNLKDYGYLLP